MLKRYCLIIVISLIALGAVVYFYLWKKEMGPAQTGNVPFDAKSASLIDAFPSLSFKNPVAFASIGGVSETVFVALQEGKILILTNDRNQDDAKIFLDLTIKINWSPDDPEGGLLGLTLDPHYKENGHFYVYYTVDKSRRSILSRFSVTKGSSDQVDIGSELIILEVGQPFPNHNGGGLAFGPDGYLYLGLGDGGKHGDPEDPYGNGQNLRTVLGKILRIDVSVDIGDSSSKKYLIPDGNPFIGESGARNEIWAYGFRNPWRFSFDRLTGDLWLGDVGAKSYEEIDVVERGRNYGWKIMEGAHCFPPLSVCADSGLEPPIAEYTHPSHTLPDADQCHASITGGYVYRGTQLKALYGAYVYADFCGGNIWAILDPYESRLNIVELLDTDFYISSFGEDEFGELYILTFQGENGKIYKLNEFAK